MKVLMKTSIAAINFSALEGQVVSVSDEDAKRLVRSGQAAPYRPEAAVAPKPPENAMKPRPAVKSPAPKRGKKS